MTRILHLLAASVLGALVLALVLDSASAAEKRVALVIGNSDYRNVPRLPNPEKDAAAVAKLFKGAGFDTVVEAYNVGNLDFKRAIRKFEDASQDADIAVVYYAGHGLEVGATNYLIPIDAKLASDRDAEDEAISLNRVVESVDSARRLKLIILDACRDDPFANTMKHFRHVAFRGIASGLGKVEPTGTDTLIAYAAKAGSTAEDGQGAHSPFTTALLDNLTVPGLDIRLAFGRVRDEVLKMTGNQQEPFVYGSLGGGNISLVPAPPKPKAPEITKVKSDYELVAQIGTKKAWEVFLDTYKTGFYADLARAQIAKLTAAEASKPTVLADLEQPPTPQPVKPTTDETRAWSKVRDTSDKDKLEAFIKRYPNSPLAVKAQHRLDILDRTAKEREEKARAAREAAAKAEQARLAQEQARIAAQQRAEEEERAKVAARLAALKAENERRAKEAAESEIQKKEQAARIAALQAEVDRRAKDLAESEKQKAELACRHEQDRLDDLKAAGDDPAARDDLKRLSNELTCERLRPQVVAALEKVTSDLKKKEAPPPPPQNTPQLITSAQKELARLGCYSGDTDGTLDAETKVAIKKYKTRKGEPTTDIAVTDSFVKELGKEKLRVCPAAVVEQPKPERQHKETKKETKRHEETRHREEAKRHEKESRHERREAKRERSKSQEAHRERPQAREQASNYSSHAGHGGGGGGATMIGIGF